MGKAGTCIFILFQQFNAGIPGGDPVAQGNVLPDEFLYPADGTLDLVT